MTQSKPHLHVACTIIEKDGRILAAQRSETMSLPLKWEFPGGKLEPGESAAACLAREIAEELGIGVAIGLPLPPSGWSYAAFDITLYPFLCTIGDEPIRLHEHRAIRWLAPEELFTLDWAAADGPVLENYLAYRRQREQSERRVAKG